MRYNILFLSLLCFALSHTLAFSQMSTQTDTVSSKEEINDKDYKHSISSSIYILGNFAFDEPVYDFHINYDYHLTQKDVLVLEGMT